MSKITGLIKKISPWLLYIFAIIVSSFAINYLQKQAIIYALISIFIALTSYTFLIIKSKSAISGISYVTIVLFLISMMTVFDVDASGEEFLNVESERMFYLVFGPATLFILSLFLHLIRTQQNWKKKTSFVLMILTLLYLLLLGTALPNFHDNFGYTRIFIGVILVFSIALIRIKKKLFVIGGIIGIILTIVALLLSSTLFLAETYNIEKTEKEAVLNFVNPKIQNMLQFYNQRDFSNFCKDCGDEVQFMIIQDTENIGAFREQTGAYVSCGDPKITFSTGFYYVEYPIVFKNVKNTIYLTLMLTSIKPEDKIYGFSFSTEQNGMTEGKTDYVVREDRGIEKQTEN